MAIPVVLGRVEMTIRHALVGGCSSDLEFRPSEAHGPALVREGRAIGAAAVITRREDIVDLCGELPGDLLVIGISSTSWTVLVCWGEKMIQIANPEPERLTTVIQTWLETGTVDPSS